MAVPKGADRAYPKAKYTKDESNPNGYRARRVGSPEEEARLGPNWVDHPDDAVAGKKAAPKPKAADDPKDSKGKSGKGGDPAAV